MSIISSLLGRTEQGRTEFRLARTERKSAVDLDGYLVTILYPTSAAAEAYRTLGANLLYTSVDNLSKVVMLTSSSADEGKSITCANLGAVLAQAGKSTLILDCNLLKPTIHELFGLSNHQGLTDVLEAERSLPSVWKEVAPGLKVVTARTAPLSGMEFLRSQRFSEVLASVREGFDYVLVDTPPVGMSSAPIVLAWQADGVLLVLDVKTTRKDSVRQAMHSLKAVGANVLGTVVNNIPANGSNGGYRF
jgi:capsular exopolysaccharide synthesis family protein